MKRFLLILSVFLQLFTFSQTKKIDSLLLELKKKQVDTSKIVSLNNLAIALRAVGNYDTALIVTNNAVELSIKNKYDKGLANSYGILGTVYYNKALFPKALHYNLLALKLRNEQKDKKAIAALYNNLGNIYRDIENYTEAFDYYNKSLKIKEELKDKKGVAGTLTNIGNLFAKQKKFAEAITYYEKSLGIKSKLGDDNGVAILHNNIGIIKYEEGLIKKQQGNTTDANTLFLESLKEHNLSVELKKELKDKNGLANSYCNIGNIYLRLNDIKKAETFLNQSLKLSQEVANLEDIKNAYQSLLSLDTIKHNYELAYKHYASFIAYRDSILNKENTKKYVQEKMQFEFDLKESATKLEQEKKDAIAKEEEQKQKIILLCVIIGLVLVGVFAALMYNRFRITKKQKEIIESQKTEVDKQRQIAENGKLLAETQNTIIEKQKHLVEEKQKEILDSIHYASRIQKAMLTGIDYISAELKAEFFILYEPKDIVAGDFYWALKHHNLFYLAICDCTGHGVPGAFMSLLNIGFLNEIVIEKGIKMPHEILNYQRNEIIKALNPKGTENSKDGMDCVLCAFDFENNMLYYAAANNSLYILRDNELIEYKGNKMPVGLSDSLSTEFTLQTIKLQKNDIVYAFTDGYPDQFGGPRGKKYKYKQLEDALIDSSNHTMEQQCNILLNNFTSWKGSLEQVDDVCLVGIKI